MVFGRTWTPKRRLRVKLPSSVAVEQSDHAGTLEKSSIAPMALASSVVRLLVRDTLRSTTTGGTVLWPLLAGVDAKGEDQDTLAAAEMELPLLSAA